MKDWQSEQLQPLSIRMQTQVQILLMALIRPDLIPKVMNHFSKPKPH